MSVIRPREPRLGWFEVRTEPRGFGKRDTRKMRMTHQLTARDPAHAQELAGQEAVRLGVPAPEAGQPRRMRRGEVPWVREGRRMAPQAEGHWVTLRDGRRVRLKAWSDEARAAAAEARRARRQGDPKWQRDPKTGRPVKVTPAKYPQVQEALPGIVDAPKRGRAARDWRRGWEEIRDQPEQFRGPRGQRNRAATPVRKFLFGRAAEQGAPPTERRPGGRDATGRLVMPTRRRPDTRPGTAPADPRDPYQFVGQPAPLPRQAPGPMRTVPPNWPARDAPHPGSAEPVILDFPRTATAFASHYGEGRHPRVPAWRWGV